MGDWVDKSEKKGGERRGGRRKASKRRRKVNGRIGNFRYLQRDDYKEWYVTRMEGKEGN